MDHRRFGFVIGIINVLYYILITIYFLVIIIKTEIQHEENISLALYIMACVSSLIMIALSILMIVGISKLRHYYIAPWLIFTAFGLITGSILMSVMGYIIPIWELINSVTLIATTSLSCYSIYLLWRDIKNGIYSNDSRTPEQAQPPPYVHSCNFDNFVITEEVF
ncbi:uncharacterized protein [Musca autumnalis]|uniref:uncharacterized protein n=1 Tax=Musca autumnalis TaxID=221902 RepID=UPI003CEE86DA